MADLYGGFSMPGNDFFYLSSMYSDKLLIEFLPKVKNRAYQRYLQIQKDILNGNGVFAKAGEELFDDYWANFGKIEILSANKRKKLSSFSEYLQYRGLPSELNNCRASKRSTK